MPELPDIEVFKQYFDSTSLDQPIDKVTIHDARILEDISGKKFVQTVTGEKFTGSSRHGKFMFTELSNEKFVVFHFGMTGALKYFQNSTEQPGHIRVQVHFENGYSLGYDNTRMLGRVLIINDPLTFVEEHDLGPDALELSIEDFQTRCSSKRGMIKSALMDQSFIAGLGNIYVDEILFHSGMHPRKKVTDCAEEDIQTVYSQMRKVLQTAIRNRVNIDQFPENYLIHRRAEGRLCPKCGAGIEKVKIFSRSTYYCLYCQSNR